MSEYFLSFKGCVCNGNPEKDGSVFRAHLPEQAAAKPDLIFTTDELSVMCNQVYGFCPCERFNLRDRDTGDFICTDQCSMTAEAWENTLKKHFNDLFYNGKKPEGKYSVIKGKTNGKLLS